MKINKQIFVPMVCPKKHGFPEKILRKTFLPMKITLQILLKFRNVYS